MTSVDTLTSVDTMTSVGTVKDNPPAAVDDVPVLGQV